MDMDHDDNVDDAEIRTIQAAQVIATRLARTERSLAASTRLTCLRALVPYLVTYRARLEAFAESQTQSRSQSSLSSSLVDGDGDGDGDTNGYGDERKGDPRRWLRFCPKTPTKRKKKSYEDEEDD